MERPKLIDRLKIIFQNVEKYDSIEFRLLIEKEIKQNGEEGIQLLAKLLNSNELNTLIKIQLIKIAGYLRDFKLLLTLKTIIEKNKNINVKKEAIIAVSKYNDRKAINVLQSALKEIKNPLVLSAINDEIGKIKQNNPILALLPRFQEGEKNLKAFRNTVEILKKIILPKDAVIFTKFLENEKQIIRNGASEILCSKGDLNVKGFLFNYFQIEIELLKDLDAIENEELYRLIRYLKKYIDRFNQLIEDQVSFLIDLFWKINDPRAQKDLLILIAKSKDEIIVKFFNRVFEEKENLRNDLIMSVSGNILLFDFIFKIFNESEKFSKISTESLIEFKKGRDFLKEKMLILPDEISRIIAENINKFGIEHSRIMIDNVFSSEHFYLKEILLDKFKDNCMLDVKEYLFEKKNEKEFHFMGDRYFQTVSLLFPIAFLKKIIQNIALEDFSIKKINTLVSYLNDVIQNQPVIKLEDAIHFERFLEKIILTNSKELILLLIEFLNKIKTFDISTCRRFNYFKKTLISKRQNRISPQERTQLNKMDKNLNEVLLDISDISKGAERIKILSNNKEVNFELLERILKENKNSYWIDHEILSDYINPVFLNAGPLAMLNWARILKQYPKISVLLEASILKKLSELRGVLRREFKNLYSSIPNQSKIIILLSNHRYKAMIIDQINELYPHINLFFDFEEAEKDDILLLDSKSYEKLLLNEKQLPKNSFLFLNKISQISNYKDFGGKMFVEPIVIKKIILDIFSAIIF